MTIHDETVEAAAIQACTGPEESWDDAIEDTRRAARELARVMLEAAAPYMLPVYEGVSEAEKALREFANERETILLDRELPATKRDILAVLSALSSERERAERERAKALAAGSAAKFRQGVIEGLTARVQTAEAKTKELLEALQLADAALSGANMNMSVVQKKVSAALRWTQGEG